MKIVLIGSGNVAFHLGPALKNAGHKIVQVYGRSESSASSLAKKLLSKSVTDPALLTAGADLYLIALRDEAIEPFLENIPAKNAMVVHTSGSIPISILNKKFSEYGVIYPIQTFTIDRKVNLAKVPFCLEADSEKTLKKLKALIKPISENIHMVDSGHRMILHLAAVISNNFSNHLFALSEQLLSKYGLDFDLLHPLIVETAQKIQAHSPSKTQTGPARRGDTTTIEKHLAILKSQPYLHDIYRMITESIEDMSGPRL